MCSQNFLGTVAFIVLVQGVPTLAAAQSNANFERQKIDTG